MTTAAGYSSFETLISRNPLIAKGIRARLRPQDLLLWAPVTLVLTAFAFLLVYLVVKWRMQADHVDAAKATFWPIMIIQGTILMLMGTGSVASGLANEKDMGVLDYHRLSPMPVSAKIFGYMFGLPVREYVLFALTLPFLAFTIIEGEVPLAKVGQFYVVFFTSVWLYHMTGLVAGIVAPRARRAGMIAQGLVLLFYFVMPRLSDFGFSFFNFLTVRPTIEGLLLSELRHMPEFAVSSSWVDEAIERWAHVKFFHFTVHPTIFTLIVQVIALITLYIVVHRKWRQPANHAFSKTYAIVFFAVVQFFLIGSVWPILTEPDLFDRFISPIRTFYGYEDAAAVSLTLMLSTFFYVTGFVAVGLLFTITPTSFDFIAGLRRMHRRNLPRVPANADAATNLPYGIGVIALSLIGYGVLITFTLRQGRLFDTPPAMFDIVIAAIAFAACVFYTQCANEYLGLRRYLMFLLTVWGLPFLIFLLIIAPFADASVTASYISIPSPLTACFFCVVNIVNKDMGYEELRVIGPHLRSLALWSAAINVGLAVLFFMLLRQQHREWRKTALSAPTD